MFRGDSGPIFTSGALLDDIITSPAPLDICTHSDDMAVFCAETEFATCQTGQTRLAGEGSTEIEGRLEICLNDTWGTICDDSWHVAASAVSCQILGKYGGERISAMVFGDAEELPIYLDGMKCVGDEESLLACPQLPLDVAHDCTHTEDVAIRCIGNH